MLDSETGTSLTPGSEWAGDYQAYFGGVLARHCPGGGRVLDIGAGADIHGPLRGVRRRATWICGVDPSPAVEANPALDEHHCCRFEDWDPRGSQFDLAFAYNVVEHVKNPRQFCAALPPVLKPGAWFWFLTPNGLHPFCGLARLAEVLHLKQAVRKARFEPGYGHTVNDYPSYYRMNSPRRIAALIRNAAPGAFDTVCTHFFHAGFEQYLPRPLRGLAHLYDATVAKRIKSRRLILVCGLRRRELDVLP